MATYLQPLDLELGSDFSSPVLQANQSDGVTPLNVSSYSARLMLRVTPSDATPMLSLTQAASPFGQIVLTSTGAVSFSITKAGLAQLTDRAGGYDLFLDAPAAGPSVRFAAGNWTLRHSFTQ